MQYKCYKWCKIDIDGFYNITKAILCACDQPSTDKKKLKHALCMLCICFILCDGCDGNLLQKKKAPHDA
ncbi:hypothetical protein T08_4456 [Trichinella sp. T8]|nr:hypothetical protein T08_4456 [Trichinella sp. T8]